MASDQTPGCCCDISVYRGLRAPKLRPSEASMGKGSFLLDTDSVREVQGSGAPTAGHGGFL